MEALPVFSSILTMRVEAEPLKISTDTLFDLEDNLLLFFTGFTRSASSILKDQHVRSQDFDPEILRHLHEVKEMGYRSQRALEAGHACRFGVLMHEHWEHKKTRSLA